MIALVCLTAGGCVSTRSASIVKAADRPFIIAPDSSLIKACKGVVDLPDRALTQRDIERLWISDRKSLIECAKRHKALADFIKQRDGGLS